MSYYNAGKNKKRLFAVIGLILVAAMLVTSILVLFL